MVVFLSIVAICAVVIHSMRRIAGILGPGACATHWVFPTGVHKHNWELCGLFVGTLKVKRAAGDKFVGRGRVHSENSLINLSGTKF